MSSEEFEPTPLPPGPLPLGRFYSDMLYKTDSPADMIISAERFLVESGACPTDIVASFEVTYQIEVPGGPPLSLEELHDVCVTIPLRSAGLHMEEAFTFEEVQAWYKTVVASIRSRMRPVHTLGCLDSPTFAAHDGCEYGRECPVIYTAKYLEEDLFEANFDTPKYKNTPYDAQKLAIEKENIAVLYGFRTKAQGSVMIDFFRENFAASFHQE